MSYVDELVNDVARVAQARLDEAVAELTACATAADVCELLVDAQVTGLPGHPARCPVATWLRRRLRLADDGDLRTLSVTKLTIELFRCPSNLNGDWEYLAWCKTPRVVVDFLTQFDRVIELQRRNPATATRYLALRETR